MNKKSVNPKIITPGFPGNAGKIPASPATANAESNGNLIFLGSDVVTVPAGTELSVKLVDAIDTSTSKSGDAFDALLTKPLTVGATLVTSVGTPLRGQITDATSIEGGGGSTLSLSLLEIMVNNHWFPIQTNLLTIEARATSVHAIENLDSLNRPQSATEDHLPVRILRIKGTSVRLPSGQPLMFYLTRKALLETSGIGH